MADHTPRLCAQCEKPLSADEKRAKWPFMCMIHRLSWEVAQFKAALAPDSGSWT